MNTDANGDGLMPRSFSFLIEGTNRLLNGDASLDGIEGAARKQGHDSIADVLINEAL